MNLGELVQELRENILHDRSNRVAGASDQLWSDATLVRYIDEAQRRLAREGLVIRDASNPEVTTVTPVAGTDEYALHPSILAVMSARQDGDTADLARAGHSALQTYRQPDAYFFDPSSLSSLAPGKPLAYSTDEYLRMDEDGSSGVVSLRLYPVPATGYLAPIKLRVVRLPVERLSVKNLCGVPEVPEIHHLEMLDWAAYLALRIVDTDGGMPNRAMEFRASFEDTVRKARNAAMRKMFAPLQWGFGRNGFSWEQ
jgi:hypothetical protein